jgi:Flp pilus assembly protein TadG
MLSRKRALRETKRTSLRRRSRLISAGGRRTGQSLVLISLLLFSLLALAVLIMDGGMAYVARRRSQSAADAAALAGAQKLLSSGSDRSASAETAVLNQLRSYAAANGVRNVTTTLVAQFVDSNDAVVGLAVGSNGGVPSAAAGVSVTARIDSPMFFAGLLHIASYGAKSGASARVSRQVASCQLLTLDHNSTSGSLNLVGNSNLYVDGLIQVDSISSTGFNAVGNINVTAGAINVCGSNYGHTGNVSISPTPTTNAAYMPDPLASLTPPDFSSMTPQTAGRPATPQKWTVSGNINMTLNPGVYYGGMRFTGNVNITLNPGIYVFAGGGFEVTGNSLVVGDGVFIYNTKDLYNGSVPSGGEFGAITMTGNNGTRLSPMTSGPYTGLTLFQDRGNPQTVKLTGNSGLNVPTGTLYAAAATVDMTGNTGVEAAQIICHDFTMTGNSSLTLDWDVTKFYGLTSISITR